MSRPPIESKLEQALLASDGKPFYLDDGGYRYLFLDERLMQSMMSIEDPTQLLFGYTRAMMSALLFNQAPSHILMVGLGGGSMAKYCYEYLPEARITVLEVDQDVIALRDKFFIPEDSDRFRIIHTEAASYLAQAECDIDILMVDGFNADGASPELHTSDFYVSCYDTLKPDGILVTNFWSEALDLNILVSRLHLQFDYQVWRLRSPDSHNFLYFSVKNIGKTAPHSGFLKKAKQLEDRFKLGLPDIAAQLYRTTEDGSGIHRQRSHQSQDE